jgi:Rieske Fe-S protein
MKKLTYILTISILVFSCNSKEDYIQNVYVDEYVNLNLPEYSELNTSGNALFTKGGVEGIIIYHGVGDDYKVYDRNCSYQPSLSCSVIDSVNSGIAFCGCCTSAFLISNTGESINAPALLSLKTYNWSLDDNNVMRIYN